jgi:molecular chaperone DnaJ
LSDEKKRASYDRAREMGRAANGGFPGAGGPGGGFGGIREASGSRTRVDPGDLLGGMFGGSGRGGQRAAVAADLETDIKLSFEDAMAASPCP